MPIVKEKFGTTPGGESVDVYTLTNAHGLEARILSFGGILQSLRVPDRNGELDDVVLGFDKIEPYFINEPYFGSIIGRYGTPLNRANREGLESIEPARGRNG